MSASKARIDGSILKFYFFAEGSLAKFALLVSNLSSVASQIVRLWKSSCQLTTGCVVFNLWM
jgi:hypothetical protein